MMGAEKKTSFSVDSRIVAMYRERLFVLFAAIKKRQRRPSILRSPFEDADASREVRLIFHIEEFM